MWLTTNEVENITGTASASPTALAQAISAIEIYANRTEAVSGSMRTTDVYWIKQAIAWQTVGIMSDPGWIGKKSYSSVSQSGVTVQAVGANGTVNQASIMLHPLAERALKNLSWKAGALTPVKAWRSSYDFTNESSDAYSGWEPLCTD